jgi:uncharacterized protein YndB with AHSA1/START domain
VEPAIAVHKIEREILIDAPVEVVWRVLTEPEHLQSWFSDAASLEPSAGAAGVIAFQNRSADGLKEVHVEVQDVEPPHRFSFRWDHPAGTVADERNSLLVEFSLAGEGEGTRLRLVESGFEHGERESQLSDHENGWDECLARLVAYGPRQALVGGGGGPSAGEAIAEGSASP